MMFWVPHPGQPVPIFEDNWAILTGGSLLQQAMVLGAMAGIAVFAYLNIKLLVFNLRSFAAFPPVGQVPGLRRFQRRQPGFWPCRSRSP